MSRTRAYRRAKYARAKSRARRRVRDWYGNPPSLYRLLLGSAPPRLEREIGRAARTKTPCSCEACGNPRKHWNQRTCQERRALDIEEAFIAEEAA